MSNKFIEIDRTQPIILPDNLEEWLDNNDLARFIVDVVEQLDTSCLENAYRGGGSAPYPPKMMLALLFYGYAKGIFSSRQIERATYEQIPVLYITGGLHPDHVSHNRFRKRFLSELESLFVMILEIAHGLGIFKLGNISADGTKIKANASQHKAMSWEYAGNLSEQLLRCVAELLKRAETENHKGSQNIDIPAEIQRREERLSKIAEIQAEIKKRAQARYKQEKAEYDAKMVERAAKEAKLGRKLGGRKSKEPEPGPRSKDQVNFTDEDSRIMPKSGGGFIQGYNAQAAIDIETMLIVGQHVTQNTNDKQEVEPTLAELDKLPSALGTISRVALDSGYFSADNVEKILEHKKEPYIPNGRQNHNQSLEERFAEPPCAPKNANPVEDMQHRMKTTEGKEFYAKRKSTVEPIFGIIKEIMGFHHFMLRGFEAVKGEWTLVSIAYNLKRFCVLNA
ncbi:Transposase, IS4 [Beggiatoa sp. PS]|nr:Transposase, IS4 [Beggiatoa sp. PS]